MIAKSTSSRLNICKTIALKDQLIFNFRLLKSVGSYNVFEFGSVDKVFQSSEKSSLRHLSFLGKTIESQKNVLIRAYEYGNELLNIEKIVQPVGESYDSVILECTTLSHEYDCHYGAFEICGENEDKGQVIVRLYDLFEFSISYKVVLNGKTYVLKL